MATSEISIPKTAFNSVYLPYLDSPASTQIYYGGSASGKSVFLASRVVVDLLRGERNYLICRQVGRTLRGSVKQEVAKIIERWGLGAGFAINKSDGTITCANGMQAVFVGLDDSEKLKSITPATGVFTDVWVEEATETNKATLKQLRKRMRGGSDRVPKRLTLSFNPILRSHFLYRDFFEAVNWTDDQTRYNAHDLTILKTTYKDNRFLTPDDIIGLESETDSYFREVYTLGNWGVMGDVIFRNIIIADLMDEASEYYLPPDQRTNLRIGGDFGFSNDPSALSISHYDPTRKRIYIFDELYERGLTNDVLAERIAEMGYADITGVWDSADPRSIAELNNHGVRATAAKKGKGSVLHGIQWLQQQVIIAHNQCVNHINELQAAHWVKDAGGNDYNPPRPSSRNNHLLDALNYAYESDNRGGDWLMS